MAYIYKNFNEGTDIVGGRVKNKTFPIWSDVQTDINTIDESIMSVFYTSSTATTSWESNYYYNIFNQDTAIYNNTTTQFSIAFGTTQRIQLSTAVDNTTLYTYPSYATYRQFANILMDGGTSEKFGYVAPTYTSAVTASIEAAYFISVARDRIKDSIEINSWQLNLSSSNGLLTLVSDPVYSIGENRVLIVSGTLVNGIASSSANPKTYGIFFPTYGVYVLDANAINSTLGAISANFNILNYSGSTVVTSYNPTASLQNLHGLLNKGANFKARTLEKVQSTYYYCRVLHNDYNYSTNPTWVSGSNNEILSQFYDDKKTFITTVGLYDGPTNAQNPGNLIAIAKLSRPLSKDDTKEAQITVRLDF